MTTRQSSDTSRSPATGHSNRVLVIGSAVVDIIAIIADDTIERMTMHNMTSSFLLVEQGKKTDAGDVSSFSGGGGVNAAISLARQGFAVDLVCVIGDDLNGRRILERLKEEDVGTLHVLTKPGHRTGTSIIISSHDRNAAIFTHRGANTLLAMDDLRDVRFSDYTAVYVSALSNESAACYPHILKRAHTVGCYVVSNPGIRQLTYRTEDFLRAAKNIDLLAVNKDEAAALLPRIVPPWPPACKVNAITLDSSAPVTLDAREQVGGLQLSIPELLACIKRLGPRVVTITDGSQGAYFCDGKELLFCPSIQVKAGGTTGAGDAFISTLSAQLVAGFSPSRALLSATCNAASVVGHVDTQSGLLSAAALDTTYQNAAQSNTVFRWKIQQQ